MRALRAFANENAPLSPVNLLEGDGQPRVRLGPSHAEEERRLRSWGSQMELGEQFEKGVNLSSDSAACESNLLDEDAIFLTSSGSADSALLASCQCEEQVIVAEGSCF